jgi:hypothetical protein
LLRYKSLAVGLACAVVAFSAHAAAEPITFQSAIGNPDHFKLSGSVRVRYENLDGQPRAGFDADDEQLAIRSSLFAEYNADGFRLGGELFDSRAYLSKTGSAISSNEVNVAELVQAYVAKDFADPFGHGSKAGVQLGRFTLNLGSRRLVAADDYRNTTNGYTGLRADLRAKDGTNATFIYTLPQVRLPDDVSSVVEHRAQWDRESFDLRLWGGIIARPMTIGSATGELSYFRLQERDSVGRPTRDRDLHTVGGRVIRDPKAGTWDYEVEGFYQFGGIRASLAANASELDVSAWFLHADLGYSVPGTAKLRVSIEYDRASGDGPAGTYGRFDTLFGMRRADLAPAGIYNAIGRANISTVGIRAEIAPSKRIDAFAVYRAMWLADRTDAFSTTGVRDASGAAGNFAGHQVEARVRYWLVPGLLRAEVDGVWLAKGRFLKEAPNAPATGDTHYLATALTATF